MRARVLVFPIKGRKWCFSRSIVDTQSTIDTQSSSSSYTPSTFKQLYQSLFSDSDKSNSQPKAELVIDFASNKMNRAWSALEKAPPGSFKSKLHGLGLRLLSRVKPSEIFLKSISKEVDGLDITFPSSLNARLVRRRLRHIAQSGAITHKKYFYGSVALLPMTSVFMVLPLPNIPFFWTLFRSYSHWRALKGSERLLILASDHSATQNSSVATPGNSKNSDAAAQNRVPDPRGPNWELKPSEELEQLIQKLDAQVGLDDSIVSNICKIYDLNTTDVIKYRDMT